MRKFKKSTERQEEKIHLKYQKKEINVLLQNGIHKDIISACHLGQGIPLTIIKEEIYSSFLSNY